MFWMRNKENSFPILTLIWSPATTLLLFVFPLRTSHSTRGDVPTGTSGAAGYLVQGKLYVFAGHTKDGNTNSLYSLDLRTMHWTFIGPNEEEEEFWPSPRDKFASWQFENKYDTVKPV